MERYENRPDKKEGSIPSRREEEGGKKDRDFLEKLIGG
jgi:hypothetical protein